MVQPLARLGAPVIPVERLCWKSLVSCLCPSSANTMLNDHVSHAFNELKCSWTSHKEDLQKRGKKCVAHISSQLTFWPQVYCICSWSTGHRFPLFPDVCTALGGKLKQALWYSPYVTCRARKGKFKNAFPLLDCKRPARNAGPFFLEKEHTHLRPRSQWVPVPLPIVNTPQCIFSSAFWNHAALCQTFRDLDYRSFSMLFSPSL